MLDMPWPRSAGRRPAHAVAVVLHGQPELPLADRAAHLAVGRAAVLDDVADRLAQDARGLHEGARRQQVLGRPRAGCASRPRSSPGRAAQMVSARQSASASARRIGLPVRPRTDSRISSSASRASSEMRSLSLVWTMVSSLAPRSSCRSAAMRLRSCSVTLLDPQLGQLREIALELGASARAPGARGRCASASARAARARTSGTAASRRR